MKNIHPTLVETIKNIDKTVDHAGFLTGMAALMRNPYWSNLKDEARLQVLVSMYITTVYKDTLWMHPENEGKRTNWECFMLKYGGVKPGMPDIMIFEPKFERHGLDQNDQELSVYCGCAIELKIGNNKVTPAQIDVLEQLSEKGWTVAVTRTFEETIKVIDEYLKDIEL